MRKRTAGGKSTTRWRLSFWRFSIGFRIITALFHIKETSFVCQDKRGFFLAFRAKYRANNRKTGFGSVDRLLRSSIFCFQRQKLHENTGVLFEFLCSAEKTKVFKR